MTNEDTIRSTPVSRQHTLIDSVALRVGHVLIQHQSVVLEALRAHDPKLYAKLAAELRKL